VQEHPIHTQERKGRVRERKEEHLTKMLYGISFQKGIFWVFQGKHFKIESTCRCSYRKTAYRVWHRFRFTSPTHKTPKSKERTG
jgi:hypothetical protein